MTETEWAEMRLKMAASIADERDRISVHGSDLRKVLTELKRLRELIDQARPRD